MERSEHRVKVIGLAIVLLFLAATYLACLSSPAIGVYHDDGIYAVTAKSIAEDGAYRIKSLPNDPPQTKYPPLFPLALSLVWRIFPKFPENGLALRCVPLLFCILWLWVLYRYGRAQWNLSATKAWIIVLFTAASPFTINGATTMLAECLFGAFLILTLWFIDSDPACLRNVILAALSAVAAYYTRTAALPIIVACVLYLGYKRRFSHAAVFCAVVVPLCLVWTIWFPQPEVASPIEAYYTRLNYRDWNLLTAAQPIGTRVSAAISNVLQVEIYPASISFAAADLLGRLFFFTGFACWIFTFRGALRASQVKAAHIAIALYIGMIVLWAWNPRRFLNPALPFLLIWIAQNRRFRGSRVLVSVAAVIALAGAYQIGAGTGRFGMNWFGPQHDPEWSKVNLLHRWIARNTSPDSVIMANHDPAVYLYTGRKAIRPFTANPWRMSYGVKSPIEPKIRDLLATAQRYAVDYLMVTVHDNRDEPYFPDMIESLLRSGAIAKVYDAGPGIGGTLGYSVFRFQHY
ncbi:MAG TPA: hypothetical protein VF767_03300 [Bryobacteraceae bacterium]